jgi:hypothetical protein
LADIFLQGASFITGDAVNVAAFYGKIPGASSTIVEGIYSFPCDADLPVISFTLGGQDFPMTPESFDAGPDPSGDDGCIGAIRATNTGNPFWVLGDAFMTNYYTVFDVGSSQIGFAALA